MAQSWRRMSLVCLPMATRHKRLTTSVASVEGSVETSGLGLRVAVVRPDLRAEWFPQQSAADGALDPTAQSPPPSWTQLQTSENIPRHWKCKTCRKTFQATVAERVYKDVRCPHCVSNSASSVEHQIKTGFTVPSRRETRAQAHTGTTTREILDATLEVLAIAEELAKESKDQASVEWCKETSAYLTRNLVTTSDELSVDFAPWSSQFRVEGQQTSASRSNVPATFRPAPSRVGLTADELVQARCGLVLRRLMTARNGETWSKIRERDAPVRREKAPQPTPQPTVPKVSLREESSTVLAEPHSAKKDDSPQNVAAPPPKSAPRVVIRGSGPVKSGMGTPTPAAPPSPPPPPPIQPKPTPQGESNQTASPSSTEQGTPRRVIRRSTGSPPSNPNEPIREDFNAAASPQLQEPAPSQHHQQRPASPSRNPAVDSYANRPGSEGYSHHRQNQVRRDDWRSYNDNSQGRRGDRQYYSREDNRGQHSRDGGYQRNADRSQQGPIAKSKPNPQSQVASMEQLKGASTNGPRVVVRKKPLQSTPNGE